MTKFLVGAACSLNVLILFRIRLRKKTWKNPSTVMTDGQVIDKDVYIHSHWEMFVQILDGLFTLPLYSMQAASGAIWCLMSSVVTVLQGPRVRCQPMTSVCSSSGGIRHDTSTAR